MTQPEFTYSACGPFTENRERIKKLNETGDSKFIYQKELDKACFQHDMVYLNFKDLKRRTFADKLLRVKAFNIGKDSKYDGYQTGLPSMVYKLLIKKTSGSGIKNENVSKKELVKELHKSIITKFNWRKLHSPFIDDIWGSDLSDIQLVSKFTKGFRFFLCLIYIYSKYAWVVALKDKRRYYNYSSFSENFKRI